MKPPFLIVYFMTLLDDLRKTGLEMQIMLLHSGSKNGKNISVLTIFEITCTYNFNSSEKIFFKTSYKFPQNCTFADHCELLLVYKNTMNPLYMVSTLCFFNQPNVIS